MEEEAKPKYLHREGKQDNRGWLVRADRRKRRDESDTLIDQHVEKIIKHILTCKKYTKLPVDVDRLFRLRDAAAVAMCWIFFKRGGENLQLKVQDISFDARKLHVKFTIEKKRKRYRMCSEGHKEAKNSRTAKYCKECGRDISQLSTTEIGSKEPVIKHKTKSMLYTFVQYITNWLEVLKSGEIKGVNGESWLFPTYQYIGDTWGVESKYVSVKRHRDNQKNDKVKQRWNHLTVQRLDQILQAIDPSLTSHMFRYGHTEVLLRNGYTPYECSLVGDWSSDKLPQLYAKKKGITLEEQRFSEDLSV